MASGPGGGGGKGVLLGIFGGGVSPGPPNADPISDPKNVIFHTCFQTWPAKIHTRFQISLRNS